MKFVAIILASLITTAAYAGGGVGIEGTGSAFQSIRAAIASIVKLR